MKEVKGKASAQGALLSIDNLPGGVGVYEISQEVRAIYLSRGLAKLLGYSAVQFKHYTNENLLSIVHPTDLRRVRTAFARHRMDLQELDLEFRLNTAQNRWLRMLGRFSRRNGENAVYYIVASDITEAKENALQLEQVNARLQFAFSHSTMEIWEYRIAEDEVWTLSRTILGGHPALSISNPASYLVEQRFVHPDYVSTIEYDFLLLKEKQTPNSIIKLRSSDGQYRWVRISYAFMQTAEETFERALGMFQDIDDEIETRLHVLGSDCIFFAAFSSETGRPVLADNQCWSWLGGKDANLYAMYDHILSLAVTDSAKQFFEPISNVERLHNFVASEQRELVIEAQMNHPFLPDSPKHWYRFSLSCSSSSLGSLIYIGIKDIEHTKREALLLLSRAQYDPLTRLLNRYSLEEMVSSFLEQQEQTSLAFYLIDIDNFKQVNDIWGHKVGDKILMRFSSLLQEHFPPGSAIGRLGGDEFVVGCVKDLSKERACELGSLFCKLVANDTALDVQITVSIGLSISGESGLSFSELYQHADVALYEAKDQGRNRCVVYQSKMAHKKTLSWSNHQWVLDNLSDVVYVCDLETYDLLFLNKMGRERYCIAEPYQQKKCYEVLYNRTSICPFCKVNTLRYDHFLFWVHETKDGNSILCKEKLLLFNSRTVKMAVLVDQVGQAGEISKTIFAQRQVQHTSYVKYLQLINFSGQSWDYDLRFDLLTIQFFKMGKVEVVEIPLYLKESKNPYFVHPDDGIMLRDYVVKKTMEENNEPIVIRILVEQDSYVPIMLTSYLVKNEEQQLIRLGGLIVPFVSFGFAEQPNYIGEFFNELNVDMITLSLEEESSTLLFYNKEFLRMFDLEPERVVQDPLLWLSEQEKTDVFARIKALREMGQRYETYQLQSSNGRHFSVTCYLGSRFSTSQTVSLSVMDIGNQKKLKELNQRVQLFMEHSIQGIGVFCLSHGRLHLEYVNDTLSRMLGYERKELTRQLLDNAIQMFYPEDRSLLLREIEKCCLVSNDQDTFRLRLFRKDKRIVWCEITFRQIGRQGIEQPFSLLFEDISQKLLDEQTLQKTMSQLSYALSHNLITGLYTRQRFYEEVRTLLDVHGKEVFIMVYWNIERFSIINELLGYETGNKVLQMVGKAMRNFFADKKNACYAHLESDHFAACLKQDHCDVEQLKRLIDVKEIGRTIGFAVTMAIGIYVIEDTTLEVNQLLDRAHSAAKDSRKQFVRNVSFYEPSFRSDTFNEQDVLNEMQKALDEGQFTFYLQPMYSANDGNIAFAEALARWNHPTRGLIGPIQFIPVFERYGFITTFDLYILNQICAFLERELAKGHKVVPISLNLSKVDLNNREIVSLIAQTIEGYTFDRKLLQLEVTESSYMDNPEQMAMALKELQAMGFTILMDDFGSGYSSLNMLYTLPLDILKIDRKFVSELKEHTRTASVLNVIVQLGKGLGLPVVAEGVETEEQFAFLREHNCDYVQGFYFSAPLKQQDFIALLHG